MQQDNEVRRPVITVGGQGGGGRMRFGRGLKSAAALGVLALLGVTACGNSSGAEDATVTSFVTAAPASSAESSSGPAASASASADAPTPSSPAAATTAPAPSTVDGAGAVVAAAGELGVGASADALADAAGPELDSAELAGAAVTKLVTVASSAPEELPQAVTPSKARTPSAAADLRPRPNRIRPPPPCPPTVITGRRTSLSCCICPRFLPEPTVRRRPCGHREAGAAGHIAASGIRTGIPTGIPTGIRAVGSASDIRFAADGRAACLCSNLMTLS